MRRLTGPLVLLMLLTACGSEERRGAGGGAVGEAGRTPTEQPPEGQLLTGSFRPLPADPGQDAAGRVRLRITDEGLSGSLRIRGMDPRSVYEAHVHEQPCSEDQGGEHFKFDPEGGDEPPNEVHFDFVAGASGAARAATRVPRSEGFAGRSVVVHVESEGDSPPRVACADLRPARADGG